MWATKSNYRVTQGDTPVKYHSRLYTISLLNRTLGKGEKRRGRKPNSLRPLPNSIALRSVLFVLCKDYKKDIFGSFAYEFEHLHKK